jgi:benzaldehyde dehydrogenase (NAD)
MGLLDGVVWRERIFTDGWSAAARTRPVVEPATGETLAVLGLGTGEQVAGAAERAATAQRQWAAAPYLERVGVLMRAAALFGEHAHEISDWIVRESGSTRFKAGIEVEASAGECLEAAALPGAPYGELLPSPQPRLSVQRRIPAGVVSVISPFNFPLILSVRSVAPALALGNAVLLKPDPRTGVCGGVVIARIFEEAGLPAGLLQMLPGDADVGAEMITNPRVRVVSFTGSTRAGRIIGAQASEHLTRAHLELGGNSALVVLGDMDADEAAACGAFGNFMHSGQVCMAVGRHLVHESIYEQYVEQLAKKAESLSVGNGFRDDVALGPIIDRRQLDHVVDLVARSVDAGARLVAGGTSRDLFYRPTVLADCGPDTPAYAEEVFGPVAAVRPFGTVDEVVDMVNDSEYGLSLGVLTHDIALGLAIAERAPAGLVHVNDQTFNDDPAAPFGGLGSSGLGRVGGKGANLDAFTETQWITVRDRVGAYPF